MMGRMGLMGSIGMVLPSISILEVGERSYSYNGEVFNGVIGAMGLAGWANINGADGQNGQDGDNIPLQWMNDERWSEIPPYGYNNPY